MKVLVTGGAGFIGSHVAKHLVKQYDEVVVLDDLSGGFETNVPAGAKFIAGSINDAELISTLFDTYKFDYVFHLAAYAAEGLSHFIKRFNYQNNLIGSVNLINESVKHHVKCFVFTSSIAVYGEGQLPMRENMTPIPEDPYGNAKLAVENELRITHDMFNLNYVIFRPHNVYGENQNLGDRYRNVIGIFMNQLMQNLPLTVYGDGEQTRAFSYIDDVAPHIANCVKIPAAQNQIFNIGADKHCTVNELAHYVMDAMQQKGTINYLPHRNEVMHVFSDHTKARKVFELTDPITLEAGLASMAAWAKKNGSHKSKPFKHIEIYKKLPPHWLEQ
ncbi:MAG: NAD-dependent epimerase/dehydratase family protein [Bacteroidia bacterium]|nr:NAD-dependent epimerase/dehydratase family protein [Bacteroidia bacterium]